VKDCPKGVGHCESYMLVWCVRQDFNQLSNPMIGCSFATGWACATIATVTHGFVVRAKLILTAIFFVTTKLSPTAQNINH